MRRIHILFERVIICIVESNMCIIKCQTVYFLKLEVDCHEIIKVVATRCEILRVKCTEIDFGWGSLQRLQ